MHICLQSSWLALRVEAGHKDPGSYPCFEKLRQAFPARLKNLRPYVCSRAVPLTREEVLVMKNRNLTVLAAFFPEALSSSSRENSRQHPNRKNSVPGLRSRVGQQ